MEPRRKKKKSMKWTIAIPVVLVLISSILVFNGRVLSNLWGVDRNIEFNGQVWDMLSGSFDKNWITNSDSITFTVDLSDDFENAALTPPAQKPFNVIAAHEGNQVDGITYQEVGGDQFAGKYTVNIPFTKEGRLDVTVEMLENEAWSTDGSTHVFNITRDASAPVVTLSGVENDVLSTTAVTVDVEVLEKYFASNSVQVTATQNGKEYTEIPAWKNTGENTKNSYTFTQEGEYTFTVNAMDEVGNKSAEQKLSFAIRNKGPVLSVSSNGSQIGEISNAKEIDILVTSGISIDTAAVTIYKDGTELETKSLEVNKREAVLKYPISADGQYELRVVVKDSHARGENHNLEPFSFISDKTAPVIKVDGVVQGQSYDENKEVTVNIEDLHYNKSDFLVIKKSITGRETTNQIPVEKGKSKFKTDDDGEYTIKLTSFDQAGNQSEKTLTFYIDKEKPVLSLSEDVNGKYFNEDKDLTISVEDLTLDLNKTFLKVKKNAEEYLNIGVLELIFNKAQVKHKFTEEGKYEINLSSTDGLGHSHEMEPVTFTIDKTAPKLAIENVKNEESLKEEREVKISAADTNMDWAKTYLYVTRNGIEFLNKTGEEVSKTHKFSEDGIYQIHLESTDKAGNKKVHEPMIFTIDKTPPELKIEGVENNGHYMQLENLELSIEDLTFLPAKTTLVVKKDGTEIPVENEGWEYSVTGKGLKKALRKLDFTEDGDYEISLKSIDFLGFESSAGPVKFTIDRKEPVIDISGITDQSFVQKGKEVKIEVTEHNFEHNNVKVYVTRQEELDGEKVEYPFGEWKNDKEVSKLSHTFNEDGDYQIFVEATDKAGNKAESKSLRFTVDNEKPVINISGVKQDSYYSNGQNVKIEVDERNFKNNNVDINVTKIVEVDGKETSVNIGEWKNVGKKSSLSYTFDQDGEYNITVNATDAAGNQGVTETMHFTVDKINPELSITGVDNDNNYRTDKLVNVNISDRNIDLSQTNLKVLKNGKAYNIGNPVLSGKTTAVKAFTFSEEGSYVINLNTADKAGNKKVYDQIAFIIDKTNPVVKIDGVDNNSFNPTSENVTISVDELNFETNNVDISATKDGGNFNIGSWRNTGKLSKLGYNFTQDGLYTIVASAKDKAGNGPITKQMTFTVDKVKPSIEIKGVDNNAYYNVDKPVSIAIRDENLDVNRISVTRSGSAYNAGSFSVKNDVASLSHNFSKEGEYKILVEATDKAGNSFSTTMTFTIDKTKPVITPKFKGQNRVIKNGEYINEVFTPEFALDEAEDMIVSATLNNGANLKNNIPVATREMAYTYKVLARDKAGNESTLEISFTLDTTKPQLNISGVLDGFFNKDITPKVTYSDVHLDRSNSTVTLNGKPFENGTKLEYEKDYELKAVIRDLAKNETKRTIVFTIDKTSPVIKFKDPISNKYFNQNLLPELLIEDMSAYDIIAMMLDGKPYEIGDPIKEEGKHVMFFEVKDKAGNIQQLSVEFIIDKTAPKVIYEGVKKSKKYHDPVDISIRLDNPNDTLKAVMINGELFEGDVVEENGYKVIKTTLTEINSYEIKVTAYDEAGNETNTVIPFEIVQKGALVKFYENKPLFGGTLAGAFGLIAAAATVLLRRRKEEGNEE